MWTIKYCGSWNYRPQAEGLSAEINSKFYETCEIEVGDNVHTIGCKIIQQSVEKIKDILDVIKNGGEINRVPQWSVDDEKIYRLKDFNENVLNQYLKNLNDGIVDKFLKNDRKKIKVVDTIRNSV